jgi:hypothetical protein
MRQRFVRGEPHLAFAMAVEMIFAFVGKKGGESCEQNQALRRPQFDQTDNRLTIEERKMTDRTELLRGMFTTGSPFIQVAPFLYHAVIDGGVKIGVMTATLNSGYLEYALNLNAERRLLAAKAKGKIGEAYTVLVRTGSGQGITYCGHRDAEELYRQYEPLGLQRRSGRLGDFITLPAHLTESDDDLM